MVRETSRKLSQTEHVRLPRAAKSRSMNAGPTPMVPGHTDNDLMLESQIFQAFDDEQAEASNDEFEMVHSIPTPVSTRKRQRRRTSNTTVNREDQQSLVSSRRARRASGEHLWKHRCFWDEEETECLREGVRKYGKGKWKAILSDAAFKFKDRSTVDLKDKWRNLETFVPWSDHEMRRYILLDETHAPIRTSTNGYHIFQNRYCFGSFARWPRDAALKVASRDEFYSNGPDDNSPFLIYLREIKAHEPTQPIENVSEEEQIVHVYQGTRERKVAADIEKFQSKRFMWVPSVVKLRTEKLSYGRRSTAVPVSVTLPTTESVVMEEMILLQ